MPPPAPKTPQQQKKKSIFWAYVLWLFGGFFGLHLFYLHKDAQAFLTWSTLGGYFGMGWLSDITKIPHYVRDCNEDEEFIKEFIQKLKKNKKPPFSTSRFISAMMISYFWGQLVNMAIPEDEFLDINWRFLHWLIPLAVALGTWIVGNTGREQGSPWITIAVTYVSYLVRFYIYDESIWFSILVLCSALAFDTCSKEWRRTPPKRRSLPRRIATLTACGILYLAVWGSYLYFNGKITDSNGDEVPLHEAIHHFFNSPWWTDLKQSLYDTYVYAQHHGWYEIWKQIIDLSDVQGEQNAYRILNVSPSDSQAEITAKWRVLSREFHPDKVKDPELQREAQDRFMEIQQSYEILSNIKSKRKRKNKKSVEL